MADKPTSAAEDVDDDTQVAAEGEPKPGPRDTPAASRPAPETETAKRTPGDKTGRPEPGSERVRLTPRPKAARIKPEPEAERPTPGEVTAHIEPGNKTEHLTPGDRATRSEPARGTPGDETAAVADGSATVRLTPGKKTTRLNPDEQGGHVPGEHTVRLSTTGAPGVKAATSPRSTPAPAGPGVWPPPPSSTPPPPAENAGGGSNTAPPSWPPHAPATSKASTTPNPPTASKGLGTSNAQPSGPPSRDAQQTPAGQHLANRNTPQNPAKPPAWPPHPQTSVVGQEPEALGDSRQQPSPPADQAARDQQQAPNVGDQPPSDKQRLAPARGANKARPAPPNDTKQARQPSAMVGPGLGVAPNPSGPARGRARMVRPSATVTAPPVTAPPVAAPPTTAPPTTAPPTTAPPTTAPPTTAPPSPMPIPTPSLIRSTPNRPVDALEPERERRRRPRREGLGNAPWILTLSSLGVALVALGYAGGRYETPYAIVAYWVGQVVVFTPVVVRLLSRRLAGVAESLILVLGLALNQYLLKWMYSPDQFRFPDELQHWLGTTIINETGELFQPNTALPPAVHFPGLAEMGAGLSQLTGLPVFAAGILVAGAAHLCFVGALFALVLRASGSPTIAGVCCVVYATTMHYLFFNSMYLYQTAALPFFLITIWAVRRWRAGGGRPFLAIATIGIVLTTVSHHVTAFTLVATLALLGVTEFWADRSRPFKALLAPGVAVGIVAAWVLTVARDVIGYLGAPLDQVMQTASMLFADHQNSQTASAPVSIWQLLVQGIGLVLLLALFLALLRDTFARAERDPWRWSILAGTAVFFAGNAVRFLGSNGPEVAGRLSTFTYVPLSVVAAIALVHAPRLIPEKNAEGKRWLAVSPLPPAVPSDRTFTPRVVAGAAIITVLMIGARVGGWPPTAQLLPGPYLAIGFERSVDAYGIDAALWEYDMLGPGNRVGGDVVSVSLASTYGRQDPVREVGQLYYDDVWNLEDDDLVDFLSLNFLVVDWRLSEHLPTNQAYFENDPHGGQITKPLTQGQLSKFDALPTVSRVYDNGVIRIYRMGAR